MHFESSLSPRPHDVSLVHVPKKKPKSKREQKPKEGEKGFVAGWGSCKLLRRIPSLSVFLFLPSKTELVKNFSSRV